MAICGSFLWPSNIPFYKCTMSSLSIRLGMDTWVAFFWVLWVSLALPSLYRDAEERERWLDELSCIDIEAEVDKTETDVLIMAV